MKDTLKIECLVQSLQNVIEAKNAHDRAREWGHHGQSHVDAMETAANDFEKRLAEYIDAAVAQRLGGT